MDPVTPVQGSTGVLKTSRLPTWVVNLGGEAYPTILLDQVLRGQPACHQISVRATDFFWIAHTATECVVASLSSCKDVSTAMLTDPVQPLH